MQNSRELFAERQRLADNQASLFNEGKEDEARVVEGQIKQIDITLDHILEEEDKLRNEARFSKTNEARTLGELVLGPRNEFRGLEIGDRREVRFRNEGEGGGTTQTPASTDPTVVTVGSPTEIDLTIPGKNPALLNNFASTLPSVPAVGSVSYRQRSTQYGSPDTWGGVKDGKSATKEEVIYTWKDAVANKETVAGYVPISKESLRDYDELMGVINSDLLIDLNEKTNSKLLTASNNSGIVGIQNTTGILAFTAAMGGLYYDAIRIMRTQVMKTARRIPTHVCLHPDIKQAIDLYKTETGLYQPLGSDGSLWGMIPVEDFDCGGLLVYDAYAAKKRPIHGITVEPGYINDQFVNNELSLLAEHTLAFQVTFPDAFCYAAKADLDKTETKA